jgi:hypothetical protein
MKLDWNLLLLLPKKNTIATVFQLCLLSACQRHGWVILLVLEMQQKLRTQILYNILPELWADYYLLITPTVRSWGSQWVVIAAGHCYWQWRWWSDTLWATLTRWWPHAVSCCLQSVWRFLSNLIDRVDRLMNNHLSSQTMCGHSPVTFRLWSSKETLALHLVLL